MNVAFVVVEWIFKQSGEKHGEHWGQIQTRGYSAGIWDLQMHEVRWVVT
ncbi:hypothetical protein [Burkholderia savannae]|nr:hypothetical protein [Burkholderia savannae]